MANEFLPRANVAFGSKQKQRRRRVDDDNKTPTASTKQRQRRKRKQRQKDKKRTMDNYNDSYDSYPAGDPIPEPDIYAAQYTTIIEYVQNSTEMRTAAKSSIKQGLWAGTGAVTGGMFFGPIGGLVGGIGGSIIGFLKSDNYDGMVLQLCKLDERQQHALVKDAGKILVGAGATIQTLSSVDGFRNALFLYASQQQHVRDELWNVCLSSLQE